MANWKLLRKRNYVQSSSASWLLSTSPFNFHAQQWTSVNAQTRNVVRYHPKKHTTRTCTPVILPIFFSLYAMVDSFPDVISYRYRRLSSVRADRPSFCIYITQGKVPTLFHDFKSSCMRVAFMIHARVRTHIRGKVKYLPMGILNVVQSVLWGVWSGKWYQSNGKCHMFFSS